MLLYRAFCRHLSTQEYVELLLAVLVTKNQRLTQELLVLLTALELLHNP